MNMWMLQYYNCLDFIFSLRGNRLKCVDDRNYKPTIKRMLKLIQKTDERESVFLPQKSFSLAFNRFEIILLVPFFFFYKCENWKLRDTPLLRVTLVLENGFKEKSLEIDQNAYIRVIHL